MTLIAERHLAEPSRLDAVVEGIHLDVVFDDRMAAVVFTESGADGADTLGLVMAGWNVIDVPADADLDELVAANPSVFAQARA